jgi:hypothetical protein
VRAGFDISSWSRRNPGRDKTAVQIPLVNDCLIIVYRTSMDKPVVDTLLLCSPRNCGTAAGSAVHGQRSSRFMDRIGAKLDRFGDADARLAGF